MLEFIGPVENTNHVQISTRTWIAEGDGTIFNIVCMKLSDLQNMAKGQVNFIGHEKPKFGTLEEKTDVYLTSWTYIDPVRGKRVRPLIGRFNGGHQTYMEAKQLCEDVFNNRKRYLTPNINGVTPHA